VSATELDCDVAIVGGGLAGSVLAHALAQTPLSIVLVEARDPTGLKQPSFDDRATALANGSQRILESLGLWAGLRGAAEPIRSIHISERGRFGAARILASEEDVPSLGYLVENRALGGALWAALKEAPRLRCLAPAKLESLSQTGEHRVVEVEAGEGRYRIRARLLVAADGVHSRVREELGIQARANDYGQSAIILNCLTEVPHAGRAYERFTSGGALACLPLSQDRVAFVWTLAQRAAERILELDEARFRDALQDVFGYRLGRLLNVGRRSAYPLLRVHSATHVAARTVLIGSAAINLHPVAGQGFNLALRDVAALAEVLSDTLELPGVSADPGSAEALQRYRAWRSGDQRRVAAFTHGLIRFFGVESPPVKLSRGIGLMLFDLLPGAKTALARQAMGLAGTVPRLARGLPLSPPRRADRARG
jgi:2-octaprenyl-6-methoxyphenol hydroxylase